MCFPIAIPAPSPAGHDYRAPCQGNLNDRSPVRCLDLEAIDQSAQVATNFTLDGFAQAWKGRYAVVQSQGVTRLQDLQDIIGPIAVKSGHRPPGYNAMVGGATHSCHMYGDSGTSRCSSERERGCRSPSSPGCNASRRLAWPLRRGLCRQNLQYARYSGVLASRPRRTFRREATRCIAPRAARTETWRR
ncbi:D-Ala-D-Ala carboxypeptidase family metallohydrolase [Enhygromyxa salina]|uniref:D-Ala-D-Ala carboxypeptidase family metallohydrolase n=1 Tax=Enhygromyxa salina TaxID=215803 RepID=UPI00358FC06C